MLVLVTAFGVVLGSAAGTGSPALAATEADDEIHYSFGNTATEVVVDWRGPSSTIEYGLTTDYGQVTVAQPPAILPVDSAGPFWEARLPVLPDQAYHYRVGAGADHVFRSQPTGSFRWADIGDTGSTLCTPWVAVTHQQVAAAGPAFVTHGGDVSYANDCGVAAVHQYYRDQEVWSQGAAFQLVAGNHDYAAATSSAPAGTPPDSLANYKGRSFLTNPQAVPTDTVSKTSSPGCAPAAGTTTNGCIGEDWGWFQTSGVLYISYPEPWSGAMTNWQAKVDPMMARAQADPAVDFVVTYGHRPAYSSQTKMAIAGVTAAINALSDKYSPAATAGGKYVLNVGHHVHGEEAFGPQHGVVQLTNGGGGEGQASYSTTAPGSLFKTVHPGYLVGDYDANAHTLAVDLRCGPDFATNVKEPCTLGSTLYSVAFSASATPPPPPPPAITSTSTSTDYFATCDTGVESGLSCFGSRYNSTSLVSWVSDGYQGVRSVRVDTSSSTGGTAGLEARPNGGYAVTSTVAGRTYNAGVWLKASVAGEKLSLYLRERRPDSSSPGSSLVSWTAPDTLWHLVESSYTAKESGNAIPYKVYGSLVSGGSFQADSFSLTSPS